MQPYILSKGGDIVAFHIGVINGMLECMALRIQNSLLVLHLISLPIKLLQCTPLASFVARRPVFWY
jgi:hypothetical protein